jgi:hypothetical protein
MARTREEELREVPLWTANKERWPPGVRGIGTEEMDCLGVDRRGNLYWDGKPVEVRRRIGKPGASSRSSPMIRFLGLSPFLFAPILFRFPLDRWCRRILALDPVPRPGRSGRASQGASIQCLRARACTRGTQPLRQCLL